MRVLMVSLALAMACRPGVDNPEPEVEWSAGASQPQREAAPEDDDDRWWLRYDDPTLHALIDQALRQSPNLRTAFAAIAQARALTQPTSSRCPLFGLAPVVWQSRANICKSSREDVIR